MAKLPLSPNSAATSQLIRTALEQMNSIPEPSPPLNPTGIKETKKEEENTGGKGKKEREK
jgi:hypothetical protein